MKTTEDITLYDLMAEDFTVYVKKNKQYGFDLSLENYDESMSIEETIHPCAMESMYNFCVRFIHFYSASIENGDEK